MRKLVKKLALVLALVMAIGCIAPASAQAAQVAEKWTWNFDEAGLVKPTKSMLVGETYKFQVLMYGEALDAEEYSVKYYAKVEGKDGKNVDCDAVIMNTKTGLLYAAEAAKDIKIAAVVKNSKGGTAKVWAFLDVYAASELEIVASPSASLDEALEIGATFTVDSYVSIADGDAYDLDVTATIADEKVLTSEDGINFTAVGAGETEIVFSAEGIAPTTLNVVVAAPVVVTPEATPSPTPTVEVALAATKVVQTGTKTFQVTFNKDLTAPANGAKYATTVKIAAPKSTVAIKTIIASAKVEGKVLTVELYNEVVTKDQTVYIAFNGVEAPAYKVNIGNPAKAVLASNTVLYDDFVDVKVKLYDSKDTFLYEGTLNECIAKYSKISASISEVEGVYFIDNLLYFQETGASTVLTIKYDKTVIASETISSVKEEEVLVLPYDTYEIGDAGLAEKDYKALGYVEPNGENVDICVGDTGKVLYAKRLVGKEFEYSAANSYTYVTTDDSVVLVNKDSGVLYPIKTGYVDIVIYDGDKVVGACTIKVKEARKATTLAVAFDNDKNTISSAYAGDKAVAKVTVYDQYGEVLANPGALTVKESTVAKSINGLTVTFTAAGKKAGSYDQKFTVGSASKTVKVVVLDPGTKVTTYKFDDVAALFVANPADQKTITIAAREYGASDVIRADAEITASVAEPNKVPAFNAANADKLYYNITKVSGSALPAVEIVDGELVINPFNNNEAVAGTYTIALYKYTVLGDVEDQKAVYKIQDAVTISVVDGKASMNLVLEGTNVEVAYATAMDGVDVADTGKFTATGAVSGSTIDSVFVSAVADLFTFKVDGKEVAIADLTEIKISGYADGTSKAVITDVVIKKGGVSYSYTFPTDDRAVISFK